MDRTKIAVAGWMNKMLGTMIRSAGGEAGEPITPLLQSKNKTGNSRRLLVGSRKLKAGDLVVGNGGEKVTVVAEKRYVHYGEDSELKKQRKRIAVYYPLKNDLQTLDTSVELSMRKDGEWTTRRHEAPTARESWLKDGAFDSLDVTNETLSQPGRYVRIGARDFCYADVEGWHKDATKTDRQLVERLSGAAAQNGEFRLLNADLSPGAEVQLATRPGQASTDPFTDRAVQRVKDGFAGAQQLAAAAAARGAIGAGVDVDLAIDVANDLAISIPPAHHPDIQGCGIAAAVTATARRAGVERADARRAGQEVLSFHAAAQGGPAAQNAAGNLPPPRVLQIQRTATAADQCLADAQADYRTLDRSTLGPAVNGIDGLARFVFEETKPGSAISEAQAIAKAGEAAYRMVVRAEEEARKYRAAADSAVTAEATARDRCDQTRAALTAVTEQMKSILREQQAVSEQMPGNPASDQDGQARLTRLGTSKRALDMQFRDLESALNRQQKMLEALKSDAAHKTQQADEALKAADAIKQDYESQNQAAQMQAAARAMLATRAAAPDSLEAGKAAAHAALNAMRSGGDDNTAQYSAGTATLAVLAGGGAAEAAIAGMAAARFRQTTRGRAAGDVDATAAQALIARSALGGAALADADRLPLAAAAAVVLAGDPAKSGAAASILNATPPSQHPDYTRSPACETRFFVKERDSLAKAESEVTAALEKTKPQVLPPGYEPLSVVSSAAAGEIESGYEHARIRTVRETRVSETSRQKLQKQYIEVVNAGGSRSWVEYVADSTANEMIGRIVVKPSGQPDTALGGQCELRVAFNGFRKEWVPLSSRTKDMKAIMAAINREIDKLAVLRDSDWSFGTTPYRFGENTEAQSIVNYLKGQLTPLITNYMRGRVSGTTYERDVNVLKATILQRLQHERSRKKHLTRTGMRLGISIIGGALGLAVGLARVGVAAAVLAA
ncbi:MAG TPA: hypothetical protein VMB73_02365 [Acetobacteraceae bacterium]|nr:hypothetical protein [Acetobacteraceae bacterium]